MGAGNYMKGQVTKMLQACLITQRYLDVKGKDKFTQLEECEVSGV